MKRFNLYLTILSLLIDIVALFTGLIVAYQIRAGGTELYYWPFSAYLRFIALMVPVWIFLLASQGIYNPRTLPRGWNALGRLLIGLISGWGVMLIVLYLWRSPQAQVFPRLVIAYGFFWTLFYLLVGRLLLAIIRSILRQSRQGTITTVILAGNDSNDFIERLRSDPGSDREIVAILRENNYLKELPKLFARQSFDELIMVDPNIAEEIRLRLIDWAETNGCMVAMIPSVLSVRASNVEIGTLGGTPIMYFLRTPLDGWGRIFKRLFDIVLVIPMIIILSPFYLFFLVLVPLTARGPAIFRQARVGQDGKIFYVHKFRSMYIDGDKRYQMDWSGDEATDPRITPLGRFLRKTNLDEIPQLFDIFIGSMSIVGPRPEQPQYVEKFSQEVPDYLKRHHVKSGLTGWAQVNGLRGNTSISERVKYDLYYIENWSIWFDVRIIISTFVFIGRQLVS